MSNRIRGLIALTVLILIALATGFYTVDTDEVKVILRWGKYSRTVTSGAHFKLPFGIEAAKTVPQPAQILKEEFGRRNINPGEKSEIVTEGFDSESLMITGDIGVVRYAWVSHYKVSDPKQFLFNYTDPIATFRMINMNVMKRLVGDCSYDETITWRKSLISAEAMEEINQLNKDYNTGLVVTMIEPQEVGVLPRVQKAFDEVNNAQQDLERKVNEAYESYNKQIPLERGKAQQMVLEAEGEKTERINEAKGRTSEFLQLAREWNKDQKNTELRLTNEVLQEVLPKTDLVILDKNLPVLKMLDIVKGGK